MDTDNAFTTWNTWNWILFMVFIVVAAIIMTAIANKIPNKRLIRSYGEILAKDGGDTFEEQLEYGKKLYRQAGPFDDHTPLQVKDSVVKGLLYNWPDKQRHDLEKLLERPLTTLPDDADMLTGAGNTFEEQLEFAKEICSNDYLSLYETKTHAKQALADALLHNWPDKQQKEVTYLLKQPLTFKEEADMLTGAGNTFEEQLEFAKKIYSNDESSTYKTKTQAQQALVGGLLYNWPDKQQNEMNYFFEQSVMPTANNTTQTHSITSYPENTTTLLFENEATNNKLNYQMWSMLSHWEHHPQSFLLELPPAAQKYYRCSTQILEAALSIFSLTAKHLLIILEQHAKQANVTIQQTTLNDIMWYAALTTALNNQQNTKLFPKINDFDEIISPEVVENTKQVLYHKNIASIWELTDSQLENIEYITSTYHPSWVMEKWLDNLPPQQTIL